MIEIVRQRRLFGHNVELYSQPATAQDEWVIEVTRGQAGGYFVEIGGYDGLRHSNTLALEESFGWTGLLVEPDPDLFEQSRRNRPNCRHLCVAAAHYKGQSRFTRGGPFGGLTNFLPDAWKREHERRHAEEIFVNTTTLYDLFDGSQTPKVIDYLSLDTEGAEVVALEEFFHGRREWIIRCLTVEYLQDAGILHRLQRILEPNGYILDQVRAWDACFRLAGATHPSLH